MAASSMFREACESFEGDKSWYAYARATRGLAASLYGTGDISCAAGMLRRAIQAFKEMGNIYQVKLSGLLGAKICIAEGDMAGARKLLKRAIEGCAQVGDHAHEPEQQSLLGQLQDS